MEDLTKRIIALESQIEYLDQELVAHQYLLAWLLKTHPHPEATRILSRLANEFEELPGNESKAQALDEIRVLYDGFDAYRSGTE